MLYRYDGPDGEIKYGEYLEVDPDHFYEYAAEVCVIIDTKRKRSIKCNKPPMVLDAVYLHVKELILVIDCQEFFNAL